MTKRDEITALVGEEATVLAYRGVRWYRIGVLGIFPVGFGFILVAVLLRQPYSPGPRFPWTTGWHDGRVNQEEAR